MYNSLRIILFIWKKPLVKIDNDEYHEKIYIEKAK